VHSHADNAPLLPPGQDDTSKILQGVTTEVTGNCGYSMAPVGTEHEAAFTAFWGRRCPRVPWGWHTFAEFLAVADGHGHVVNYAPLAGHGALRFAVLGLADRAPDAAELAAMRGLLDEALSAGAFGMSTVDRMRAETLAGENSLTSAGYDGILIASTRSHAYEGQTLAEIGSDLGVDPFDALVTVLREERLGVSIVISSMSEPDVTEVLAHPATMIGSDGLPPGRGGKPHPRLYGTFPRVLGRYVRERGVLSLPEAISRMTSRPASAFGLADRGRVAAGAVADLVAFDPERIVDAGDYRDPVRSPAGIAWVMQAGQFAVRDGQWLGTRLGRRLAPR
jgi:N-acyl-D-aspartate/D-glutamate deacylase